jgi:hypothetical protein
MNPYIRHGSVLHVLDHEHLPPAEDNCGGSAPAELLSPVFWCTSGRG